MDLNLFERFFSLMVYLMKIQKVDMMATLNDQTVQMYELQLVEMLEVKMVL